MTGRKCSRNKVGRDNAQCFPVSYRYITDTSAFVYDHQRTIVWSRSIFFYLRKRSRCRNERLKTCRNKVCRDADDRAFPSFLLSSPRYMHTHTHSHREGPDLSQRKLQWQANKRNNKAAPKVISSSSRQVVLFLFPANTFTSGITLLAQG